MKAKKIIIPGIAVILIIALFLIARPVKAFKFYKDSHSGEYNSVMVSRYPLANFDFSSYEKYCMNTVCEAEASFPLLQSEFIFLALYRNPNISTVYVGIDYSSVDKIGLIEKLIDKRADINWEVNIAPLFIDDVQKLNNTDKLSSIKDFLLKYEAYPNIRVSAPALSNGIIFNPRSFDENGLVASQTIDYLVSDYYITAQNFEEKSSAFIEFADSYDKSDFPDMSDTTVILLGDSILKFSNGNDSIASLLGYFSNINVYDYSKGGASAAYHEGNDVPDANYQFEQLSALEDDIAFGKIQFSSIDKVFVCMDFGLNDFFNSHAINDGTLYSYECAFDSGIKAVSNLLPGCKIVILGATYTPQGDFENKVGNTLYAYLEASKRVADANNCLYLDNYNGLLIDKDNYPLYYDGDVHLNAYGRYVYTRHLTEFLKDR